jgi:acyl-CoA reductase-like NAD-dependent aldehyde dehydrogenase
MTASSSLDDGRLNATVPLIIGNKDVVTSTTFEVMNPETGTMAHECSSASVADAMHAVDSAQTAFPAWSQTKPAVRRDILLKTADIFLQRKEEFLDYMRDETGAERMFSEFSFMLGVNLLKDIAGRISSIEGTVPVLAEHGSSGLVYKEPFGVILGIAPWYRNMIYSPPQISTLVLIWPQERTIYPWNASCSSSPCCRQYSNSQRL